MTKIQDFYIEYESQWGIFEPGDEVRGKMVVNLTGSIMCDSIQLQFYGSTRVLWIERKTYDGRYQPVSYRNEDVYFDHKRTLWQAEETEADGPRHDKSLTFGGGLRIFDSGGRLSQGKHVFKFVYTLPADIPTSFEAKDIPAYVRYFAKASLVTNGCVRVSKKAPFCVCAPVNLPQAFPECALPQSVDDRFILPRSTFPSRIEGTIDVCLTLGKTGYVPGEPVTIQVSTQNNSNKLIKEIRASLWIKATAYALEPEPETTLVQRSLAQNRVIVATPMGQNLSAGALGSATKTGKKSAAVYQSAECSLYVPAVSPNHRISEVLETEYFVQVEVVYSSSRPPIQMRVPVVIGTVPVVPKTTSQNIPGAGGKAGLAGVFTRMDLRGELLGGEGNSAADSTLNETSSNAQGSTSNGAAGATGLSNGAVDLIDFESSSSVPPVPPAYDDLNDTCPPTYEESVLGTFDSSAASGQGPAESDAASRRSSSASSPNHAPPKYKVYHHF